jgi:hypothetical protein
MTWEGYIGLLRTKDFIKSIEDITISSPKRSFFLSTALAGVHAS